MVIEAARVDGATAWSVFWQIRFRLILPTVGIVGVLTFVGNFNAFDLIYTTQKATAGPNYSTDILGTFFYRTFFGVQLQPGNPTMGATVAGVMFLIILAGVLLYNSWQPHAADRARGSQGIIDRLRSPNARSCCCPPGIAGVPRWALPVVLVGSIGEGPAAIFRAPYALPNHTWDLVGYEAC